MATKKSSEKVLVETKGRISDSVKVYQTVITDSKGVEHSALLIGAITDLQPLKADEYGKTFATIGGWRRAKSGKGYNAGSLFNIDGATWEITLSIRKLAKVVSEVQTEDAAEVDFEL
jgi:hypothetical protein